MGRVARLRAAAPLELFFDLCFVAAVAQAASHLHHDLSQGHLAHALGNYLWVFFAIWWAWMNFTWFASVYDNDDDLYRLLTLVQIAGALVMAAPHRTQVQQGLAVGAPLAVWILTVWWLRVSPLARGPALVASPLAAVLVLAAAWTPTAVPLMALITAVLSVVMTSAIRRQPEDTAWGDLPWLCSSHSRSRATASAGCSAPARSARRTRIAVMLMARVSRAIPAATRKPRANPVARAWL